MTQGNWNVPMPSQSAPMLTSWRLDLVKSQNVSDQFTMTNQPLGVSYSGSTDLCLLASAFIADLSTRRYRIAASQAFLNLNQD